MLGHTKWGAVIRWHCSGKLSAVCHSKKPHSSTASMASQTSIGLYRHTEDYCYITSFSWGNLVIIYFPVQKVKCDNSCHDISSWHDKFRLDKSLPQLQTPIIWGNIFLWFLSTWFDTRGWGYDFDLLLPPSGQIQLTDSQMCTFVFSLFPLLQRSCTAVSIPLCRRGTYRGAGQWPR